MEQEFVDHQHIFLFDFFSLFLKMVKNRKGVVEKLEVIHVSTDNRQHKPSGVSHVKDVSELFQPPCANVSQILLEIARSLTSKESVFVEEVCRWHGKTFDLHAYTPDNTHLVAYFKGSPSSEKSTRISKKSDAYFSALNQLSLSASYTDGKIYEFIREMIRLTSVTLKVDHISVWFLDERENQMRCFDSYDQETNHYQTGRLLRKSQYLSAFSYLKDHPIISIRNIHENKDFAHLVTAFINQRPVKSLLQTGIRKDGFLHGILCIEDSKNFRNWDQFDEDFAIRVSQKISVVLGNFQRGLIRKNLMMSQARLQSIFRSSPAAIGVVKNRVMVEVNASFSRITGYQPEEILGKSSRILYLTQEEFERVGTEKYRQMDIEGVGTIETVWRHKNGRHVYVLLSSTYLDPSDISMGSNFTAIDITSRVLAERKLKESEQRYHQISDNIPGMIYQFMMDEQGVFKNVYVNPYCEKIFGIPPHEFLKKEDIFEFVDPDDRASLLSSVYQSARDLSNWKFEFWITNHKGERKYLKANSKPRRKGDMVIWDGFLIDATAEKQSEELTHDLAIANKSLEFKKKFLANMSHQVRTPLTGILGVTNLLENTELSSDQKDLLNTLKTSGMDLNQTIDEILDYAKIEAGKITAKSVQFSMRDLLKHVQKVFDATHQKSLSLLLDIPETFPEQIVADKYRIKQILQHLLFIIVKFYLSKKIIIKTEILNSLPDNGLMVKVSLENTGSAIHDHLTKEMLNPYQSGAFKDNDDLEDFDGTGLGLAISKEFVEMLGGELTMDTLKGKVNRFSFTFTAKVKESTAENHDNQSATPKNSKEKISSLKILLVDDKVVNQKVIKLMLEHIGHKVQLAINGKEALDKFRPGTFDLILMDIKMPVMDGICATQELKKRHAQLPPIVGLSANAFEGDREKYMNLGMDEYLTKPLKIDAFQNVVDKLFGNI